ncbi:hypothetical protein, partial [Marinicauda pacifica]|uniref:hypothetical protein n=1 Tax=Marinicauda pacifica TaxID=1133559 RepID=UPI001A7F04B2
PYQGVIAHAGIENAMRLVRQDVDEGAIHYFFPWGDCGQARTSWQRKVAFRWLASARSRVFASLRQGFQNL